MATKKREAEAIWIEKKGYWQIKVQKGGERPSFTSSTPGRRGKHEAEAKADEWLESRTRDVRFEVAWAAFLKHEKEHTGEPTYIKVESLGRLWIVPRIKANMKLIDITPAMWAECVEAPFREKNLSRRTCKNVRTTIGCFISFARRQRWTVETLGHGDVVAPKGAKVGARHVLQPDALRTLFNVDWITKWGRERKAPYIHAWRLIVVLGLRRGELCGIRNEDIQDCVLHIRRSINSINQETSGKNDNARRSIYLPQIAQSIIASQRAALRRAGIISPWLFPNEFEGCLEANHLQRLWTTYKRQHGLQSTLHELRHTFVTLCKADMPEQLLKDVIGHSEDTDTFGVYGHEITDDMKRAANIIDQVFARLLNK